MVGIISPNALQPTDGSDIEGFLVTLAPASRLESRRFTDHIYDGTRPTGGVRTPQVTGRRLSYIVLQAVRCPETTLRSQCHLTFLEEVHTDHQKLPPSAASRDNRRIVITMNFSWPWSWSKQKQSANRKYVDLIYRQTSWYATYRPFQANKIQVRTHR